MAANSYNNTLDAVLDMEPAIGSTNCILSQRDSQQ
jgi:hypothetical protein